MRKRQERAEENEQQRNERLAQDRLQKKTSRAEENDQQRAERLANQRHRSAASRRSESEQQRSTRLTSMRDRWKKSQERQNDEQNLRRVQSVSLQRRRRITTQQQNIQSDRSQWPSVIPNELKERCLQDFIEQTSMAALGQSTCIVCNARVSVNSMTEYTLGDIPNRTRLVCHSDLMDIIPGIQDVVQQTGLNS